MLRIPRWSVPLVLFVFAACQDEPTAPEITPGKASPPPNPVVAFVQGGTFYVMNADGSNKTAVLSDPSPRFLASTGTLGWTPEGDSLVVSLTFDGAAGWGIYVVPIAGAPAGKQVRRMRATPAGQTNVSVTSFRDARDRFWVAYNAYGTCNRWDIWLSSSDGEELFNATGTGAFSEFSATFSPTGDFIATHGLGYADCTATEGGTHRGLWVHRVDWSTNAPDPAPRNVTDGSPLQGVSLVSPDWARRGDSVVVRAACDLWIVPLGGPAGAHNITNTAGPCEGTATWSPDDQYLIFSGASTISSKEGLFRMRSGGLGITSLGTASKSGAPRSPAWRP